MIYLLTPLCFLIDQYSKAVALKKLAKGHKMEKLNGKIKLQIVYNEGAFLGFLKKKKKLLMIVNVLALGGLLISVSILTVAKGIALIKLGAALIYGGALGNIYDRMKRKKVVDFFSIEMIPNIYFNIADLFIFIGAILLSLGYLVKE